MSTTSTDTTNQNRWLRFIRDNWQWIIPLLYIYVSLVGMIDAWFRFHAFGINVFEFSEINDFLMAALREPTSFLMVVAIVIGAVLSILYQIYIVPIIVNWLTQFRFGKLISTIVFSGGRGSWAPKTMAVLYICLAPVLVPYAYTKGYGDSVKNEMIADSNRQVKVTFRATVTKGEHNQALDLLLIGTTEKYLFFHNTKEDSFIVAPIANVLLVAQN